MPRFPTSPIVVTQGAVLQGPPGPQGPPGSSYVHRYTYQFLAGSAITSLGSGSPLIVGSVNWDLTEVFSTVPAGLKCLWRGTIDTTASANPVFMDLYDVAGITNGSVPTPIPGSQVTTSSLSPVAFSVDLSSIFSTLTATGVFHARMWLNPTAPGQQAIATLVKMDLEWTP